MKNREHRQPKYDACFLRKKIWRDTKLIQLNKTIRKYSISILCSSQDRLIVSIRKLFRWWGRYFESRGKIDEALGCYRKAEDNLSLCRLLCEQDEPAKVNLYFRIQLMDDL